jgi:acyl-CoA reductase-like NAD-dependent aldehyde dehydrogenase
VPQVDDEAVARVRAAWELGLDEGATCIAGGDASAGVRQLPPTVFTNVESYMATAKRQEPLPVLCLLRGS